MKKLYYWANDIESNSGEGILALNFIHLLKRKYKNYKYIQINKLQKQENLFYNYLLPFWGIFKIWIHYLSGHKVCYINYLPIWNLFIFIFLPKKTILGPITGTNTKNNFIYNIFKILGIFVLKKKNYKLLFSHNQFRKYFSSKNKYFFNFLFYKFRINKKEKIKKFDIIFYYKKNNNKGNKFLIRLINKIPGKFKIAVIGDMFPNEKQNKNIINFGVLKRDRALQIINFSKFALTTKENHFSFFSLDSLSNGLCVFYNKDLKLDKNMKTNMLLPISFKNLNSSSKFLNNQLNKKIQKKYFIFKKSDFSEYL